MTITTLNRKSRITYLNIRIAILRLLMRMEPGVTDKWRALASRQIGFITQRNNLLTADEIRKIEKKRGLA